MHVQRFLASAWATLHGPSEPRRLLVSVLEAQFAGLAVSPGPRTVDWAAVAAAAADLPFRFGAVRAGNPLQERSATAMLAAAKDGERDTAVRAVRQAVAVARQVRCPVVVLDPGVVPVMGEIDAEDLGDPSVQWAPPRVDALLARRRVGRNAALDRVCREVFQLIRSFPDIDFCLTQSRSLRGIADVTAVQDICEDLAHLRVGYWHDAALAARREQVGLEPQGEWLERFANRCRGMSLGDGSPDGVYLPPGAGGVDYGMLATYLPHSGAPLPVVIELDVSIPPAELPGIRSFLDKNGL
jgi:sugar phosphate isomerase/epimerase